MYFVYLLISLKNNKSYIGFTNKHPSIRLSEHNSGSNTYTRQNGPWKLIYYESFTCENCARSREKFFKTGMGKKIKKIIIENFSSGV